MVVRVGEGVAAQVKILRAGVGIRVWGRVISAAGTMKNTAMTARDRGR